MNLFQPQSQNKTARMLFYIFELAAIVYFFVAFIMGIISAAQLGDFGTFIGAFFDSLMTALIVWGIGRLIDFLSPKE